ncbi:probable E3 ubiquitin-protein ligase DTX2 isoform X2 [Pangasianodon hypophthalmus]|uniref:probable E3 ubiquitin-protein ligase DTX2 isoform X2 n=1 Tax=Pangasianodon hypophthalmus TaxID=310915 RepID=UPI000EFDC07D|nr:probable E3 ubiquitin-protein ligase DTX2 isoform X2 [Pangasianodon hypophthalmus]
MATASGFSSGVSGSRSGASLSAASSGAGGQAQAMAVVWEWQDDTGSWRPYSGQVSCFIEQCLQHHRSAGPAVTTISLGQSDPSLAAYIIDIPSLKQFRQDTGKIRSVRRSVVHQSSALGNGVLWEWANDEGGWTAYETRTSSFLERSYLARQTTADLGPQGHNYLVDFTSLEQVNKNSGYRRRVRRQTGTPYPPAAASGTGSVIHSGPACTCQQCLSHGPMPGRSRHSFSAGAGPSSAYSPYPRRPLSVGNMAWGGPWSPAATSMAQPPGPAQSFPATPNGLSIPSIPLQLNGSSSVSAALAAAQKPEEVIKKYMEEVRVIPDEDCMICMERLSCPSGYDSPEGGSQALQPSTVGKFTKCGHTLHMLCMLAMYNNGNKDGSLQCPSCKTIYGEKTGTQPKGKMEIYSIPQSLPGHPDCGTIQIIYNIPPGIQGAEHPNPGQPYTCRGFPRFCFLPDNDKGRKVLELLKVAWTRRLIFTVGTSNTTGEPDTVVWNEIHHKTEMMSNVSGHGYPDPNYLDNVLAELAAQGVTEDCLKRDNPRPREPE